MVETRGGQGCQRGIDKFGDIYGDVTAVALCPSVLPEVTGYFGYLVNNGLEGGAGL